ncbi:MAG TPA: ATP synthase F1 subunit epsilon [Thermoanaerobaculia bacterium]|nr:ATP synthase F1 subunit epsilon [Thermoanaerobaculia bacterium]
MSGRLTLTVVTPERAELSGVGCDDVVLPGLDGEIGILPAHTPFITLLGIGVVTYRDGGRKTSVAVRGGFAEISGDAVRVLADAAFAKAAIDAGKAAEAKAAAEARRAGVAGDEELDAVNADVRFAEAELAVAAS